MCAAILLAILVIALFLPTEAFSQRASPPSSRRSPVAVSEAYRSRHQDDAGRTTLDKKQPDSPYLKTEVAGFLLEGKKPWEIVTIEDLDTVVTSSGHRLLPLLRLLKAFQMEVEEKGDVVSFTPVGTSKVSIDTQKKEMELNGGTRSVPLVVGVSDITLTKDIYLPPEILSVIFSMKIEWDDQGWRFACKTDQRLGMWKIVPGASLLAIQTKEAPTNLPELFPAARPGRFSLDFMELQARPSYTSTKTSSDRISIEMPKQTFWGSAFGGRYKLQFSEPWIARDNTGFQTADSSPIMLNRGDWTYSFPDAEIAAGDSIFGLNDITFPTVRMTGVRFNGLVGFPHDENRQRTSPGMGSLYMPPQAFEGTAPIGSKVELIVNDRSVETQEIAVGTYRFEDIRLAPGSLNLVRIVITEPSGYQRVTEQSIFGKSIHLPKGGVAYLGGVGTNRQVYDWSSRGLFGGGRVLYGLNDSLTVGTTWAAQQGFYQPIDTTSLQSGERPYPGSSLHAGGQLAWLPSELLLLAGDMSLSSGGQADGSYDGIACKIKGEFYPSRNIQVLSQLFRYGPDFFNGENLLMRDKEGYVVNGRWNITPKIWASSTIGAVRNNLDHHADTTLYVDFQNLEIASRITPRLTITTGANRISPNWEGGGPKVLYTLKVQATTVKNIYFDGFVSAGDYLDPAKQPDFFSGLRLPGLSLYRPPHAAANLTIPVTTANTVGAAYWEDMVRQRGSIIHTFMPPGKPFQVRTELGYDINYQKPFFENRFDYLLDRSGTKRIGLFSRHEQGNWTASLVFSFTQLFSHNQGTVSRVSDTAISPDRGGVHGRVFVDANANGRMDPKEPGVEGVTVILDNVNKVATDRNGYFLLPCLGQTMKSRVFIDADTVPAIYTPTHAIQTAYVSPGGLTQINFGITPVNSISGIVQVMTSDRGLQALPGARVYLTFVGDEKQVTDSITANDGGYYIGDIRPGKYYLQVDTETLPPESVLVDQKRTIEVHPKKEPQELKTPPFHVNFKEPRADKI